MISLLFYDQLFNDELIKYYFFMIIHLSFEISIK